MSIAQIRSLEDIRAVERERSLAARNYPNTSYEIIERAALALPESVCLRFIEDPWAPEMTNSVSYAEFAANVNRAANLYRSKGIARTDVVSLVAGASPWLQYAIWGAQAAGVANPINPYLEPAHIAQLLRSAEARILVVDSSIVGVDIASKLRYIENRVPTLCEILVIGGGEISAARLPVSSFDDALGQYSPESLDSDDRPKPEDLSALFHTGGTTGFPKLAKHTHQNESQICCLVAEMLGWERQDKLLVGLPLFHVNGLLLTGLAGFAANCEILMLGSAGYRTPGAIENLSDVLASHGVTFLSAVPTIYSTLLRGNRKAESLKLKFGICGGAPLAAPVARRVESELGIKLLEGYGMTEATMASTLNPVAGERRPGSIGLRIPYQSVKVVKLDPQGKTYVPCKPGDVGEIVIKGENVMPGYLDLEATAEAFTEDGYLKTGDLAWQDDDGYFWLTGRSKDLIIRGGHNIDPRPIEDACLAHPGVEQAAAVGQLDGYAGEIPVVFVTSRRGASVQPGELANFVGGLLPERAAIPKHVYFISELPQTAVGKVDKEDLRRVAAEFAINQIIDNYGLVGRVSVLTNDKRKRVAEVIISNGDAATREALVKELEQWPIEVDITQQTGNPNPTG